MDFAQLNQETIAKAQEAILGLNKQGLQKATVQLSTGITGYNLEAPAKLLVPLLSPFRQSIGRKLIAGQGTNWKKITAVTPTTGFFPAEGVKANLFALTVAADSATYKTFGRGGDVTWEGQVGSGNFEDAKARAEALLLLQVLKEEELVILGGNVTALNSGAGPDVTVVAADTGGNLAADEYFVNIKALTMEGSARASQIARPAAANVYDFSTPVPTLDTSVGCTDVGTEDSGTVTTGVVGKLTLTWTPVAGAVAYAVYIGLTTGDANLKLQGIVTQSEVVVTAINTTGAVATQAADTSANSASFNGIIPQLIAGSAYIKALTAPLSAASGHQIAEIADALTDIYDRTKVEPDRIVVGWQEQETIDNKLAAVTNDRINIVYNAQEGGVQFKQFRYYPSPISGKSIPIESNPNIPGGMMLFLIDGVPYENSQIPAAWQMHMGAELQRLDYAMTAPKDEFEIRGFGALAGYAPALQGLIYDIHRY